MLMRKISIILALVFFGLALVSPAGALAACNPSSTVEALQCGANDSAGVPNAANPGNRLNDTVKNIINILTSAVGVISVVMIVVGGFKYITSGGSSDKVSSAKSTIIYAVIGIVVAVLAQLIVKFALKQAT